MNSPEPVLTMRIISHLTGSGFTTRSEVIVRDGKDTNVFYVQNTNGRPKYQITERKLVCGEEELDLLEAGNPKKAKDWIIARTNGA